MLPTRVLSEYIKVATNNSLSRTAAPYLRELANMSGASVCLSVERDMSVVYIDTYDSKDQILKSLNFIGKTAPMHCTGTGKLFLTNYNDEQLEHFAEKRGLSKNTVNTITTLEALKKELDLVRKNGFALDNEECELGARCVAVPIKDYTGRIVAGVSITGVVNYMTQELIDSRLESLTAAAESISEILYYSEKPKKAES